MTEHPTETEDTTHDRRVGQAVIKGVVVATPLGIIGLTLAVWLITDLGWGDSFVTALLPGVLLGGFAGGFAAIASTSE